MENKYTIFESRILNIIADKSIQTYLIFII